MGEVLFHDFVLLVSIVFLAVHDASFFLSSIIGLRRFLCPRHAMSGFAIVCGELTGMARMPIIDGRRFSFYRHLVFDTG